MPSLRSTRVALVLIVVVCAAAYWPVLDCGFIWDDDDYVTRNPVLRTLGGFWRIWFEPRSLPQYYPLVHTTFWLEYRLWGAQPLGYHVVNVLLHGASALLLFRLLRALQIPGALFATLLFAAHPVHVESVAWITERKNVLSLACYLTAALYWLRWYGGGSQRHWWVASAWFLAALLGKTVTASLPAALCVVVWWQHGKLSRRALLGVAPWLLIGAVLAWFTVHLEATHVRASDTSWQLVGPERLLVAGRAVWFYLGSLFWPFGVCFNYPRWQLDPSSPAQWSGLLAALLALVAALGLQRRLGRGPAAVLLLFVGTLTPALGFFDVFPFRYSFVADHFQYHASLAVLVGSAAVGARLVERMAAPRVGIAIATAIVVLATGVSHRQVGSYRDLDTLWSDTLACNPDSTLALVNLGALAEARGDLATARQHLERALELDPTSHEALLNLGVLAHRQGDRVSARRLYEAALQQRPDTPAAMNNLAVLHLDEGRPTEALPLLEQALQLDSEYYDAHVALAWALHDDQQWERALTECEWVLARTPDVFETRERAVDALLALGRHRQAAGNALLLIQRRPESPTAREHLARALAHVMRTEPADEVFSKVGNACRNGQVDPAPILPLVEGYLRELGATPQADALAEALR